MTNIVLRMPVVDDGSGISRLVRRCPPLDVNSHYLYLLLCHHFSQTCAVAELDSDESDTGEGGAQLAGFMSAYSPPGKNDTLFVWQVAVDPDYRGQRLARRLVEHVLERDQCRAIRFVEATISPSNRPSQAFFHSLADRLGAECAYSPLFGERLFPADLFPAGAGHEAEDLYRIGPLPRS